MPQDAPAFPASGARRQGLARSWHQCLLPGFLQGKNRKLPGRSRTLRHTRSSFCTDLLLPGSSPCLETVDANLHRLTIHLISPLQRRENQVVFVEHGLVRVSVQMDDSSDGAQHSGCPVWAILAKPEDMLTLAVFTAALDASGEISSLNIYWYGICAKMAVRLCRTWEPRR